MATTTWISKFVPVCLVFFRLDLTRQSAEKLPLVRDLAILGASETHRKDAVTLPRCTEFFVPYIPARSDLQSLEFLGRIPGGLEVFSCQDLRILTDSLVDSRWNENLSAPSECESVMTRWSGCVAQVKPSEKMRERCD